MAITSRGETVLSPRDEYAQLADRRAIFDRAVSPKRHDLREPHMRQRISRLQRNQIGEAKRVADRFAMRGADHIVGRSLIVMRVEPADRPAPVLSVAIGIRKMLRKRERVAVQMSSGAGCETLPRRTDSVFENTRGARHSGEKLLRLKLPDPRIRPRHGRDCTPGKEAETCKQTERRRSVEQRHNEGYTMAPRLAPTRNLARVPLTLRARDCSSPSVLLRSPPWQT